MLKRGSQYICMFLVYLMIMPVLYSANVFATLNADISGYDGIKGFRRSTNDMTVINASAGIAGQTILPNQLKVLQDPTKPFDCKEDNSTKEVNCKMNIAGDLTPGPSTYDIRLFKSDMIEEDSTQSLTIYSDNLPPTIHSFSLRRTGTGIEADFQVSDSACKSCAADICAGVSDIIFTLDGSEVGKATNNGSCLVKNSTTIRITPTNGTTKNQTLCLNAYDRLKQTSSSCSSVLRDFSAPTLINASLWYGSDMIKFHKGVPIGGAGLKVYISEDTSLNFSTFSLNLSLLNSRKEFSDVYSDISMSDNNKKQIFNLKCNNVSGQSGTYLCTAENILLLLDTATQPTIIISVDDNFGNRLKTSQTLPIMYDKTSPSITAIRSGIADDNGRYWVSRGNNSIYVDVTETGSGLSEKRIFLDFGIFGKQPYGKNQTVLTPNNCTSGWTCNYDYIQVDKKTSIGAALTVSVTAGSSDDAGNLASGITTAAFYYDDEAPKIVSILNSSICPTAPDSIELTINVSEKLSGGVTAEVSASGLSTAVFPQPVKCEETDTEDIWSCDISVDSLVTLYTNDYLNITLKDRAGNINTTIIPQEVCEAAPGTPPNVVSASATPIPQTLDKIIAGYIAYPAFVDLTLKYSNPPNRVQDIKISSCTAENATISDTYVVTPLEFKNPLLGMKIALDPKGVENATTLSVSCGLDLIIRSGNKVYQMPEKENITIDFDLKGTIFGGLNKSMQDKVEELDQAILDKADEADEYDTAIDVLGTICTIAEILAMLVALFQAIKIVVYAVGWVVYGIVYAACSIYTLGAGDCFGTAMKAGSAIYYTICDLTDYATTLVLTNAWQIDSNPVTAWDSPGFYIKMICAWFTCRLSETNNFVEMFLSSGSADGGEYTYQIDGSSDSGKPNGLESGIISGMGNPAVGMFVDYDWNPYKSIHVASNTGCLPGIKYNLLKERQILCMQRNCYQQAVAAGLSPDICDRMYKTHQCLYVDSAAWVALGEPEYASFMQGLTEWLLTQVIGAVMSLALRSMSCGYPYGLTNYATAVSRAEGACGGPSQEVAQATLTAADKADIAKSTALMMTNPMFMVVATANSAGYQAAIAVATANVVATRSICGTSPAPTCALIQGALALGCGALVATTIWLDIGDWIDWSELDWNMYEADLEGDDFCG